MTPSLLSLCAIFSEAAYPARRDAVAIPAGWQMVPIDHGDVSAVWAWKADNGEGIDILAIAGTDSANDWITNRQTAITRLEGIGYHSGFLDHTRHLLTALDRSGQLNRWRSWPLYLCGHSLGGAAAAMLPMLAPDLRPREIVTFGQPRFLERSTAWRYRYRGDLTRIVRTLDLVPDVPLRLGWRGLHWPIGGYAHCGSVLWLHDDREPTTDPGPVWQIARRLKRLGRYFTSRPSTTVRNWIADHEIGIYRRLIEEHGL